MNLQQNTFIPSLQSKFIVSVLQAAEKMGLSAFLLSEFKGDNITGILAQVEREVNEGGAGKIQLDLKDAISNFRLSTAQVQSSNQDDSSQIQSSSGIAPSDETDFLDDIDFNIDDYPEMYCNCEGTYGVNQEGEVQHWIDGCKVEDLRPAHRQHDDY
ncbi:hypothetical protein GALMADRAFT_143488 [Galerina marginata CBS 339.88]|uniref:Uncharacterized protein n=1 Tax=Galerina marginata (strain CBS 339.88) TaxID=685588 RepID=A0A067SY37_GALM3|nr:hypothetical protein GALMADRAFT_143488 [Galerina marginata CBS 339.88]